MTFTQRFLVLLISGGLLASSAAAEWSIRPTDGNPVCTADGVSEYPLAFPDGAGGVTIVWADSRDAPDPERIIHVQRLDRDGNPQWILDGVVATGAVQGGEGHFRAAGDGNGGVFLAFLAFVDPGYREAVQYVDGDGTLRWGPTGIFFRPGPLPGVGALPEIVAVATGGAIIAWNDSRAGLNDIYAQRFDVGGNLQWASEGVPVCIQADLQTIGDLVAVGSEQAAVVWTDYRNAGTSGADIYAQLLEADGTPAWEIDGKVVADASSSQNVPRGSADGSGGLIFAWRDNRNGGIPDIYAARLVGSQGTHAWEAPVSAAAGQQLNPILAPDGTGGCVFVWEDDRSSNRVYAQRLDFAGVPRWEIDGLELTQTSGAQFPWTRGLASDGEGGFFFAFSDDRWGNEDIYAQRVSGDGERLWGSEGRAVSRQVGAQHFVAVVTDERGGMIAAWQDERRIVAGQSEIYAQRLDGYGYLGDAGPGLDTAVDFPQDQGGMVVLGWAASHLDAGLEAAVDSYSVWRRLGETRNPARLASSDAFTTLSAAAARAAARAANRSGGMGPEELVVALAEFGWSLLGSVPAYQLDRYGFDAPTYGDSTATEIVITDYLVIAHGIVAGELWPSEVISASSVDNLAPGTPLNLTGEAVAPDVLLTWSPSGVNDEDLDRYLVYRGDDPDFAPGEATLIGSAADTTFSDPGAAGVTFYYRVAGLDLSGNEGEATAAVEVAGATPAIPSPTLLTWHGAFPNPFNPSTTLAFSLAAPTDVRLEVVDPRGRLVRELVTGRLAAGRHDINWDGRDAHGGRLASGVYLVRLRSDPGSLTRKIVLVQ